MDDDEEEEVLSEREKLVRKKRDKELDNILRYTRGLDTKEAEERLVKVTHETQKTILPPLSFERIQKEEIGDPEVLWLQPAVSFDLNNTANSQIDFHFILEDFLF